MVRRNTSGGRMEKQAKQTMKNCTRDIITVLKNNSNLQIDSIKEELNEDYDDSIVETSLAKLIMSQVVTLNTDIEYRINYKALSNNMQGIGIAK
jgi:hypothetical protein